MKKILAFGASSSKKSINKKLAAYTASLVEDAEVTVLDLNDFEMPLYSVDKHEELGELPEPAIRFKKHLADSDGVIISFAEHNGTYTTAFKNIFDWASKVERNMWLDKPMILLATSPGARGGITGLEIAVERFAFMNAKVVGHLAMPSFFDNFEEGIGVTDEGYRKELSNRVKQLEDHL